MKKCFHTRNRSMTDDFESFRPCFYEAPEESDQELYDAPAPSEDIWKKFQLLPTPPRSPKHETNYPSLVPSTLEKLQLVSDLLEEPMNILSPDDFSMFPEDCDICSFHQTTKSYTTEAEEVKEDPTSPLGSNLIQDCMWSGLHVPSELFTGKKQDIPKKSMISDPIHSSSECVNPTAVFPYPLNETRSVDTLGAETPSDSEGESEDEEIDVVTVNDKIQITRRKPFLPASVSMSAQVAAMHNYTAPAPSAVSPRKATSLISSRSNSPCSRPSTPSHKRSRSHHSSPNHPPLKKIKITVANSTLAASISRSLSKHSRKGGSASSRSSSDSEDSDCKRSQHNILERKRRNDLKSSFLVLRDNVPELCTNERAPKVVILKKAADYVNRLRRTEATLSEEVERQRHRKDQLQRRLAQLRRM